VIVLLAVGVIVAETAPEIATVHVHGNAMVGVIAPADS
jgi:hypothetical protein